MSRLICPNCGSEVALPEHSTMGFGITLSKEGNSTHYLNLEKVNNNNVNEKEKNTMKTATQRLEELKNRGIDTTGYFAMNDSTLIKMVDGRPEMVSLEDEPVSDIAKQIIDDGDVFNRVLDGRWIMAQMFHMLSYKSWNGWEKGYNAALNAKGYNYQWKFLVSKCNGTLTGELHRLAKRERDNERLFEKELWFNKELVEVMLHDYLDKLKAYIDKLPTYKFKKVLDYKRLGWSNHKITGKDKGDIFVDDLDKLIYKPIRDVMWKLRCVSSYYQLESVVYKFLNDNYIKLPEKTLMCQEFKNAYRGNGAYYTALNLIKFHGCRVEGMDKKGSLEYLETKANNSEGWELLGWLKEFIKDNNFDFNARMKELNI